jgi:hypothetical protein
MKKRTHDGRVNYSNVYLHMTVSEFESKKKKEEGEGAKNEALI